MDKIRLDRIFLCIDNSDLSLKASEAALILSRIFGSEVVGLHAYNALMHELAFKIMEPILPSRYQCEEKLHEQRTLHSKLIEDGLKKISLSYLKPIQDSFTEASVRFRSVAREGKNFRVINDLLSEEEGDLVMIGSSGFDSRRDGFIGSVCLRVLRHNDKNFLIIKKGLNFDKPRLVVGLDGSLPAIHALKMTRLFVERFHGELHLIYVFDPLLHREIFGRLKESLVNKEGFSFNTRQQEMIHDEFIDKGLEQVGWKILDRAEKEVSEKSSGSPPITKSVLKGQPYRKICDYASEIEADLIFVGRTGRHFVKETNIGSVAENVVRFSPCSVCVARSMEER